MPRSWYVVQTKPLAEAKASQGIAEVADFGSFLPLEEREIRHARRHLVVERPLYPGYVFAEFDDEVDEWPLILRVRGVTTILGIQKQSGIPTTSPAMRQRYACHPLPLPANVVPALRAVMAQGRGALRLKQSEELRRLEKDERVRITVGPLAGLEGLVAYDRRRRVGVLLDMLGRRDAISVPRESVVLAV